MRMGLGFGAVTFGARGARSARNTPPATMGLEGLVSKRRDRPYQAGRSKHWMKIKNRAHPAMTRVMDAFG